MHTTTHLHIGDDDTMTVSPGIAAGRVVVAVEGGTECAWLHLSAAAVRRLATVLAEVTTP